MLDGLVDLLVDAVAAVINEIIALLAAVISGLLSLLPDMPELPDPPDAFITAESWVAWFFPVSTVVDILVFVLAMFLMWQAVSLALRWAKMLNDD